MKIKAIDIHGKTHWYCERPGGNYVWGDKTHASDMPTRFAHNRIAQLEREQRYLPVEDRMAIHIHRSF